MGYSTCIVHAYSTYIHAATQYIHPCTEHIAFDVSHGTIRITSHTVQLSKEGLQNVVNNEEEANKFSTKDLKSLFVLRQDTKSDTFESLRCGRNGNHKCPLEGGVGVVSDGGAAAASISIDGEWSAVGVQWECSGSAVRVQWECSRSR
jgi:hypothetical protein